MIRFGDAGSPVSALHDRLLAANVLHAAPAVFEMSRRSFGPYTIEAVRLYQALVGLCPTGVVDGKTWQALKLFPPPPDPQLPPPDFGAMGRLERQILLQAEQDYRLQVQESPPGTGNGPRIGDYQQWPHGSDHRTAWTALGGGARGAPYAARALGLWTQEASDFLNVPTPLDCDLPDALTLAERARRSRRLHAYPRVGYAGIVGFDGAVCHCVLVARLTPEGVETREAQSPHRVTARRRPLSDFVGFVDLSAPGLRRLSAAPRRPEPALADTICLVCHQPPRACLRPPEQCPLNRRPRAEHHR